MGDSVLDSMPESEPYILCEGSRLEFSDFKQLSTYIDQCGRKQGYWVCRRKTRKFKTLVEKLPAKERKNVLSSAEADTLKRETDDSEYLNNGYFYCPGESLGGSNANKSACEFLLYFSWKVRKQKYVLYVKKCRHNHELRRRIEAPDRRVIILNK